METIVGTVFTEGGMKSHRAYNLKQEGSPDFIYSYCPATVNKRLVKFWAKGERRITCLTKSCHGSTGNEESIT